MRREDSWQALVTVDAGGWLLVALSEAEVSRLRLAAERRGLSVAAMLSRCITAGTGLPMTPAEKQRAYRNRQREAGLRTVGALPGAAVAQAAAMSDGEPVGQWLGTLVQREADRRAHEAERQRAYRARRRQQGAGDAG